MFTMIRGSAPLTLTKHLPEGLDPPWVPWVLWELQREMSRSPREPDIGYFIVTSCTKEARMTPREILEELKKLPTPERLTIIEAALRLTREDLQRMEQLLDRTERKRQVAAAAEALLPDYSAGGELTIFTALDGEDFHA
ncbi:MAG: hypothetical protein ACE5JO_05785 [Candidatus Binatia bacterium]